MIAVWFLAGVWAHPGGHERIAQVEAELLTGECPAEGLVERGRIWWDLGHADRALADFEAARRCPARPANVDREEARIHLAQGRPELAELLLESHLDRAPHDAGARTLLATAQAALGRWEEADATWTLALERAETWNPDHVLAWSEAREVALGAAAALTLVDRALLRTPGVPAFEERAIDLLVALRRYDEALRRLDARLAARPHALSDRMARAEVLWTADRHAEARAGWEEVVTAWEALPGRLRNERNAEIRRRASARLSDF